MARFFVYFCLDVFLEVLYFGDRRGLTKLEQVGRRIHWMVENYLPNKPFLCLKLLRIEFEYVTFFIITP